MKSITPQAKQPRTLMEAVRHFSDLDVCDEYLLHIKWPDGKPKCPECGSGNVGRIKTRRKLQCREKGCRKQFSFKTDTIFEDSPLGLDKWFVGVWFVINCKNGISSYELSRAIGVTQKSAWHMLHRIRLAMQTKTFEKIVGEIESDETFVGGKRKYMHANKRKQLTGRGTVGKAIVHGMLQRTTKDQPSQVRVKVVPNQKRRTLQNEIRRHVKKGEIVYTDKLASYEGLNAEYVHEMIDHAVHYVDGRIHTNGMENFWSLFKRCLKGTYVKIAPWHLFRYLDEETFRFNKRNGNDASRFKQVMRSVVDQQLTWMKLTGSEL